MSPIVYLISGANRGIGLGIVAQLAVRENTVVFAGARNPSGATDLQTLESKYPGKVHIVKLTSTDEADNKAAVAKIQKLAGRLDVVIANAGVSNSYTPSEQVSLDAMREHFEVNVLGPLVLFQASYQLLKASSDKPKFIVVSTAVSSIEVGTKFAIPVLPYGTSKAAVNWLTAKLFWEHPGLVAVALHPGVVDTDITAFAIEQIPELGKFPTITVEESATGVLSVVDAAKRDEETGPKLASYDGTVLPW
ncbi:NAD(P)-binding protein [Calocera viscosa TUFC12733]|uniref:NAD(P)-binding protein n=1 Tax=Calocera viscosa (strain TUFC12733) TaxID=1330018 RepID=A0A167I7X5_CALVF|nr:NAD(P)-binding protein [Calocera viscosa TUFC12733]